MAAINKEKNIVTYLAPKESEAVRACMIKAANLVENGSKSSIAQSLIYRIGAVAAAALASILTTFNVLVYTLEAPVKFSLQILDGNLAEGFSQLGASLYRAIRSFTAVGFAIPYTLGGLLLPYRYNPINHFRPIAPAQAPNIKELQARLAKAQKELQAARQESGEKQATIEALEQKIEQANQAKEAAEEQLETARQKSGEKQATIEALEQKIEQANQAKEDAEGALDVARQESGEKQATIARLEQQIEQANQAKEAAEGALNAARQESGEKQATIAMLEQQIEQANQAKEAAEGALDTARQESGEKQAAIEALEKQIQEANQAKKAAEGALDAARQESGEKQATIAMLEQQIQEANQAKADAEGALDVARQESGEKQATIARLEQQIEQANQAKEAAEGALNAARQESGEKQATIEALEQQIKEANQAKEAAEEQLKTARQESKQEIEKLELAMDVMVRVEAIKRYRTFVKDRLKPEWEESHPGEGFQFVENSAIENIKNDNEDVTGSFFHMNIDTLLKGSDNALTLQEKKDILTKIENYYEELYRLAGEGIKMGSPQHDEGRFDGRNYEPPFKQHKFSVAMEQYAAVDHEDLKNLVGQSGSENGEFIQALRLLVKSLDRPQNFINAQARYTEFVRSLRQVIVMHKNEKGFNNSLDEDVGKFLNAIVIKRWEETDFNRYFMENLDLYLGVAGERSLEEIANNTSMKFSEKVLLVNKCVEKTPQYLRKTSLELNAQKLRGAIGIEDYTGKENVPNRCSVITYRKNDKEQKVTSVRYGCPTGAGSIGSAASGMALRGASRMGLSFGRLMNINGSGEAPVDDFLQLLDAKCELNEDVLLVLHQRLIQGDVFEDESGRVKVLMELQNEYTNLMTLVQPFDGPLWNKSGDYKAYQTFAQLKDAICDAFCSDDMAASTGCALPQAVKDKYFYRQELEEILNWVHEVYFSNTKNIGFNTAFTSPVEMQNEVLAAWQTFIHYAYVAQSEQMMLRFNDKNVTHLAEFCKDNLDRAGGKRLRRQRRDDQILDRANDPEIQSWRIAELIGPCVAVKKQPVLVKRLYPALIAEAYEEAVMMEGRNLEKLKKLSYLGDWKLIANDKPDSADQTLQPEPSTALDPSAYVEALNWLCDEMEPAEISAPSTNYLPDRPLSEDVTLQYNDEPKAELAENSLERIAELHNEEKAQALVGALQNFKKDGPWEEILANKTLHISVELGNPLMNLKYGNSRQLEVRIPATIQVPKNNGTNVYVEKHLVNVQITYDLSKSRYTYRLSR